MTLRGIYTHLPSSTHFKQWLLTLEPFVSADPSPLRLPFIQRSALLLCHYAAVCVYPSPPTPSCFLLVKAPRWHSSWWVLTCVCLSHSLYFPYLLLPLGSCSCFILLIFPCIFPLLYFQLLVNQFLWFAVYGGQGLDISGLWAHVPSQH